MPQVPLIGGAYQARSLIANAQRCINLFPEKNQPDSPYPSTHYPTPGLTLFTTPPVSGAGQGVYRATNGMLYACVGGTLYMVSSSGVWTSVGSLAVNGQAVMTDNGASLVIVGNTAGSWSTLGSTTLTALGTGYLGSSRVDYVDGFLIFNQTGTPNFFISRFNDITFDPVDVVAKIGFPDPIVGHIVMHREIWFLGSLTGEVFYDSGAADFPFQILPGVFIEQGCVATYSIAKQDLEIFWLSQSKEGKAMVMKGNGYKCERISTHAIENTFSKFARLDDAVGFTYQKEGHVFYQLSFPTDDQTWVYDCSTQFWHERNSLDSEGAPHRHRANGHAFAFNKNIVIDYQTGALYYYDADNFTDNGQPIQRLRSFPHLKNEDKYVEYKYLIADFEVGTTLATEDDSDDILDILFWGPGPTDYMLVDQFTNFLFDSTPPADDPPRVSLRYSDDGGFTWSDAIEQDFGGGGEYRRSMKWSRLGGTGRDRVFELSWSSNNRTALNGAVIDPEAMST